MRTFSTLLLLATVAGLMTVTGCSDSGETPDSAEVVAAKKQLQGGQAQAAIDALGDDDSAEAHYLKAVALEQVMFNTTDRTMMQDAAFDQIAQALERDPDNPKYRGFQLRLGLHERKPDDLDELIQLHKDNPSSAANAWFAFFAFGAKSVEEAKSGKGPATSTSYKDAIKALKTSVAFSEAIPEFQREMLGYSVKMSQAEEAGILVDKLADIAHSDVKIAVECVDALVMIERAPEAIELAAAIYESEGRTKSVTSLYATALAKSPANAEVDRIFQELIGRHKESPEVVSKYAIYLGRSNRMTLAGAVLQNAIDRAESDAQQLTMMYVVINLALETESVEIAERFLDIYRDDIRDRLLLTYFEGRLLFLKKDHRAALQKLMEVVELQKASVGSSRRFAQEALQWTLKVLKDELVAGQLSSVVQAVEEDDE